MLITGHRSLVHSNNWIFYDTIAGFPHRMLLQHVRIIWQAARPVRMRQMQAYLESVQQIAKKKHHSIDWPSF